jgi:hypothetical protein
MLSDSDAMVLIDAGFIKYEVDTYAASATKVDLETSAWQYAVQSRRELVARKKAEGRSDEEIENMIMDYYKTVDEASPYDWLREIYGIPSFTSPLQHDEEKYDQALQRMRQRDAEKAQQKTKYIRRW